MVDLPQHAAQLAAWVHRDEITYHPELFELNLRTPYLTAYLVARVFALGLPVIDAFKAVVGLSVVGHALALYYLCSKTRQDVWLSLLGYPVALGYNFLFGFVSYLVAIPLVIAAIAAGVEHSERPSLRSGAKLTALLGLTLATHGIAFAQTLMVLIPLLFLGCGSRAMRVAPVPIVVVGAWIWLSPSRITDRLGSDSWEPSLRRFLSLPGLLLGSGRADQVATILGCVLLGSLVLVVLGAAGLHTRRWRLLPMFLVLVAYAGFPAVFRGYGPLWPRFAWLLVPCLILAARPTTTRGRRTLTLRAGLIAGVAISLGVFVWRTWNFQNETAPWHSLAKTLPGNLRMRTVVFDPMCNAFPGLPALVHLAGYYYVEKGGTQGYSFAQYPSSVVRFREGVMPKVSGGAEWAPERFVVEAEIADFDCFVLQSVEARDALLTRPDLGLRLCARSEPWSAYCRSRDPTESLGH